MSLSKKFLAIGHTRNACNKRDILLQLTFAMEEHLYLMHQQNFKIMVRQEKIFFQSLFTVKQMNLRMSKCDVTKMGKVIPCRRL